MTKSIDIILGDLHVGHVMGIAHPDMPDGKTLTKTQRWLFTVWDTEFLPAIWKILDDEKPDYVHCLLGGLSYWIRL
jgi:hypothetical protein